MSEAAAPDKPKINIIHIAAALVVIVALVVVMKTLSGLIQPLVLAVFFFYLGEPIYQKLIKWKVPSFLAYIIIVLMVLLILLLIGWVVGAHANPLAERFPAYKLQFQKTMARSSEWIFEHLPVVGDRLKSVWANQALPLEHIEKAIKTVVGGFVGFMSYTLLVLFFFIFISQEASTLSQRLEAAYGPRRAARILEIGHRINRGIIRYVYVKGLASVLVALLSTIAMLIFQLDLAILWGSLIFFGNFIPYVGSAVAVILPLTICFLQFGSWGALITLGIILISCQVLVGNYLEPKYAGQQLNLSPLIVMISLVFWGWLWGVVGLLLSIPIMVSLKFVLENIPATRPFAILLSQKSPPR